jgi:hypothetical protein
MLNGVDDGSQTARAGAATASSASTSTILVEPGKLLGKPSSYDGSTSFRDWRFAFETWFSCISSDGETTISSCTKETSVIVMSTLPTHIQQLPRVLYLILSQSLKGRPLDILKSVEKNNGFEAYRQLSLEYEMASKPRILTKLQQIMNPTFNTAHDSYLDDLLKWENDCREFTNLSGETLSETIKIALVLERSPVEIKTYLQLNDSAMKSYAHLKETIKAYIVAAGRHGTSMDVSAISGKGKGGKAGKDGKGKQQQIVCHKCGKPGHKAPECWSKGKSKGKGKDSKGGKDGKGKGKEKGGNTGKGKGDRSPANSSFQGGCHTCGRWGHQSHECWKKNVRAIDGNSEIASTRWSQITPGASASGST